MGDERQRQIYNKIIGIDANTTEDYMSDIVPKEQQERARELANNHVDWLLDIMRPLLIAEFIHGFRHGFEQSDIAAIEKDLKGVL